MESVVNEHVVSNNLYAKRGIKIRRRKKNNGKKALDIHVANTNQEIPGESDSGTINSAVSFKRFADIIGAPANRWSM